MRPGCLELGYWLSLLLQYVFSPRAGTCEENSGLDGLRETGVRRRQVGVGGSVPCQCGESAGEAPWAISALHEQPSQVFISNAVLGA